MEEYKEKNKLKIILIIAGILVALILIGIWIQKKYFGPPAPIESRVYPTTLSVGDTLHYSNKASKGSLKQWDFGDGNISVNDSGYYFFRKPGYFQVKLIVNGQIVKSYSIQVLDKPQVDSTDTVTKIDGPIEAIQFENVIFRANTKTAKLFSWKFGESGTIDSKDQMVIYAYQKPGTYTVSLYTDQSTQPITQQIRVVPAYKEVNDTAFIDDPYAKIDNDFKYHLQQIADGANFNSHYNYLLNKYLCNNENASVKVNTSKINTFYYYCTSLQFDKNNTIQSVKVSFDENMHCVTKVEIVQEK